MSTLNKTIDRTQFFGEYAQQNYRPHSAFLPNIAPIHYRPVSPLAPNAPYDTAVEAIKVGDGIRFAEVSSEVLVSFTTED